MTAELKPCFHCRGVDIQPRPSHYNGVHEIKLVCRTCGASGPRKKSGTETAEAWNAIHRHAVLHPMSEPLIMRHPSDLERLAGSIYGSLIAAHPEKARGPLFQQAFSEAKEWFHMLSLGEQE